MVFSNPAVVQRVNADFIPVALKAGLVNRPPPGAEGRLYREIARSQPVPQGICTANSAGKVIAWALSFDDDANILKFLDHVAARYRQSPGAATPVRAERFVSFPSRRLPDVEDTRERIAVLEGHPPQERCPAVQRLRGGTLVGRIIGRTLDDKGRPTAETTRQENYMEARLQISDASLREFAAAVRRADGTRFPVPDGVVRDLISSAYLGQLDVNPLGSVPGSRNDRQHWEFTAQAIRTTANEIVRVRIEGESDVAASQIRTNFASDGRDWEHRVVLSWQGYVDMRDDRVVELVMLGEGNERLRWGNDRPRLLAGPEANHLMAGHAIDLDSAVRYAVLAAALTDHR